MKTDYFFLLVFAGAVCFVDVWGIVCLRRQLDASRAKVQQLEQQLLEADNVLRIIRAPAPLERIRGLRLKP